MADNANKLLQENIQLVNQSTQAWANYMKVLQDASATQKTLNEQLKNVKGAKEFATVQKQIEGNIKAVALAEKEAIKNQELLRREQEKTTREQLKTSVAQDKVTNAIKRANGEYQKASKRLTELRNKAKNVALQFGLTSKEFRKAATEVNRLDRNLKKVDAALGQSQRFVGQYERGVGRLGGSFRSLAGAFGFVGGIQLFASAIKSAVKIQKEFESQTVRTASVLGKTRKEIKALEKDSLRLGATTVKTATDVSKLQEAYARLGFSQEEILDLTEDTINGSIALNAELDQTAELTGAIVRTFDDLGTTDAGEILDQLTLSTQKSALNFTKLQTALPIVAGAANTAGISFTKLLGLLGKLSDSGIDASSSATALRNIFIESAKQGLNYEEILTKIVNEQDKLTAANDEFGKRAAVSATILAKNIKGVNDLDTALQNAGGTAEKVATDQLQTLDNRVNLLNSAWEGLVISVNNGDGAIGQFAKSAIDELTKLLSWLTINEDQLGIEVFSEDILKKDVKNLERLKNTYQVQIDQMKASWTGAQLELAALTTDNTGLFGLLIPFEKEDLTFKQFQQLQEDYRNLADLIEKVNVINDALAKKTKDSSDANDDLNESTVSLTVAESDLIKIQEELLKQAKKLSGTTEKEIAFRNAKVTSINEEISRLKALGNVPKNVGSGGIFEIETKETTIKELERLEQVELDNYLDKEKKKTDILKEQAQQRKDLEMAVTDAAFESLGIASDAFFSASQEKRDMETQAEIDALNQRLENEKLDEEQRLLIQADIDKKEAALKNKKAKADRNAALIESVINTALSIGKTAATIPFPAAIPFIAFAAIVGAAQQIAIASQPIPKFDKGTDNFPGLGLVGEKRPEFVEKNGHIELFQKPTILGSDYKGAKVTKGADSAKILDQISRQELISSVALHDDNVQNKLIAAAIDRSMRKSSDRIVDAIRQNKPVVKMPDYRTNKLRDELRG